MNLWVKCTFLLILAVTNAEDNRNKRDYHDVQYTAQQQNAEIQGRINAEVQNSFNKYAIKTSEFYQKLFPNIIASTPSNAPYGLPASASASAQAYAPASSAYANVHNSNFPAGANPIVTHLSGGTGNTQTLYTSPSASAKVQTESRYSHFGGSYQTQVTGSSSFHSEGSSYSSAASPQAHSYYYQAPQEGSQGNTQAYSNYYQGSKANAQAHSNNYQALGQGSQAHSNNYQTLPQESQAKTGAHYYQAPTQGSQANAQAHSTNYQALSLGSQANAQAHSTNYQAPSQGSLANAQAHFTNYQTPLQGSEANAQAHSTNYQKPLQGSEANAQAKPNNYQVLPQGSHAQSNYHQGSQANAQAQSNYYQAPPQESHANSNAFSSPLEKPFTVQNKNQLESGSKVTATANAEVSSEPFVSTLESPSVEENKKPFVSTLLTDADDLNKKPTSLDDKNHLFTSVPITANKNKVASSEEDNSSPNASASSSSTSSSETSNENKVDLTSSAVVNLLSKFSSGANGEAENGVFLLAVPTGLTSTDTAAKGNGDFKIIHLAIPADILKKLVAENETKLETVTADTTSEATFEERGSFKNETTTEAAEEKPAEQIEPKSVGIALSAENTESISADDKNVFLVPFDGNAGYLVQFLPEFFYVNQLSQSSDSQESGVVYTGGQSVGFTAQSGGEVKSPALDQFINEVFKNAPLVANRNGELGDYAESATLGNNGKVSYVVKGYPRIVVKYSSGALQPATVVYSGAVGDGNQKSTIRVNPGHRVYGNFGNRQFSTYQ